MQIIPALYIKDGKAAAYRPGDHQNTEFLDQDPYDIIKDLNQQKIKRIHLVDIDASLHHKQNNTALIGSLANTAVSRVELGGGINNLDLLKSLQYAGVDYFVIGAAMYDNIPFLEEIAAADHVPNDRIMIALDLLNGDLYSHTWTQKEPEGKLDEMIKQAMAIGFHRFIFAESDVKDREKGPDFEFYKRICADYPNAIITASGRIDSWEDVDKLAEIGVHEVVVGNEIYKHEGALDLITEYNKKHS
ncbi:HisA/HisF-related TIM barrel protein [Pontibacter sp. G13]|uniref:HisA/HisF-related TIM barrel protein n=1 Tax=Pontibacter sp. G13 TaxID=3074898 RepID=UPI00288AE576|nr:HisA/HisF-related TIM barrel protein [Pontibacter sp. G13]WNJ16318.1 HisA/HisF-related TIM barrel protein [Pontibacter sp. G13]